MVIFHARKPYRDAQYSITCTLSVSIIGGGDKGARWPPHFYGTLFARKDQNTLIEQSYSNRAVFREAVW